MIDTEIAHVEDCKRIAESTIATLRARLASLDERLDVLEAERIEFLKPTVNNEKPNYGHEHIKN